MRLISWNVNGLRAILGKDFINIISGMDADCICIQETKIREGQAEVNLPGYTTYFDYAERPGYSGTATITRIVPKTVARGIGLEEHDTEGRVVTLDLGGAYLVNVYTPNSQSGLARLPYRMEWEKAFADYVCRLDAEKPVIICGDLNVAHTEHDLANPKSNTKNPGFTPEERQAMTDLLSRGFIDTFRHLHPDARDAYSWWSYRGNARAKNVGWRIDYFLISQRLAPALQAAEIHPEITGSDHCPVSITIDLSGTI